MKLRSLMTGLCLGGLLLGSGLLSPVRAVADVAGDGAFALSDTVPSNLWLTRSLMEDLVSQCAGVLGSQPRNILLDPAKADAGSELFQVALHRILEGQGHHLFSAEGDTTVRPDVDVVWKFNVVGVQLAYPQVGRTLGIWRSWIAREVAVTVICSIIEVPSGRVLLDDQKQVRFNDRFAPDEFSRVDSPLYDFTTAEPVNGNWHDRLEDLVVLGTLAGLVAVYFANTSN